MKNQEDSPKVRNGKTPGSGRKKGTPNKNSFLFRKALDDAGFNIISELIEQYEKLPNENVELKISVLKSLLPYLYPALKEIEHTTLPKTDPLEKAQSKESPLLKAIGARL